MKALKLNPLDPQALNNLSTQYVAMGRRKEAIKFLDSALELYPTYSTAYQNRCGNKMWVRDLRGAKRDCISALKIDSKNKFTRINLAGLGIIPDPFHFTVQPRLGSGGKDARMAVGATLPVFDLSEKLRLGPWLESGYSTRGDYHFADLLGGLAMVYKTGKSSASLGAGAGYSFRTAGEDAKAPIRRGGIFQYGINYDYYLIDHFSIGATIAMQHEMSKPSRVALMPGMRLTYTLW